MGKVLHDAHRHQSSSLLGASKDSLCEVTISPHEAAGETDFNLWVEGSLAEAGEDENILLSECSHSLVQNQKLLSLIV